MSFDVPDDRRYLESHEWTTTDADSVRIGITDFAQDELGDVVFVELPAEGDELERGEEFGVVESIKAVSDLVSPVSGTVTAVNEDVFDTPELLNQDPYGDGWLLELEPSDPDFDALLSPEDYRAQIE
ncbi:glycine cleavage system H protein [Haloplanus vescus]|uniref:Probable glycine cleavage system H protein n=1 Tax=Haloplanus vescus TaxID=555874 RepID=A0A1H3YER4_9EURY|nr:glycine cleavage system protein GcvH [Haloplanus vescus]SEA09591.1 glycine cleavage system H protein [Haloplanus vescus]